MTRRKSDTQGGNESQAGFAAMLRARLHQAVRTALISVLEEEAECVHRLTCVSQAGSTNMSSGNAQALRTLLLGLC